MNGYAVVENGEINVRSVSPTRRGALVNFLATDRMTWVTSTMDDEQIEAMWAANHRGAMVVPIKITVDEGG